MHMRFGRRALGAMAGGALALPCWAERAWAADPITVTSFGGVFETTIREVIVADYEKRTGNKARVLSGSPEQWMAQVQANPRAPADRRAVQPGRHCLVAGRAGLVEKLTVDKVPNMADMPPELVEMLEGWGMVFTFGSWGFAHHERLKEPPRSFAELVDGTVKGKWRVALPNAGYTGTPQVLIWALADALGGSVDNVDPAFDAIKKMKPNASFFASITDPLTLLESGEVDISLYADGRTWAAYDSGAKWIRFVNPKEGAVNLPVDRAEGEERVRPGLGIHQLDAVAGSAIRGGQAAELRDQQPEGGAAAGDQGAHHALAAMPLRARPSSRQGQGRLDRALEQGDQRLKPA